MSSQQRNVSTTSTSPFNFHDFSLEMTNLNNSQLKKTSRLDSYLGKNTSNQNSTNSSPRKFLGDELGNKANNPRRRRSSVMRHISSITDVNKANENTNNGNIPNKENQKQLIEEEKKKKRLAQLEYIFRDQLKEEEERMKQQQLQKRKNSISGKLSRQSSSQSINGNLSPNASHTSSNLFNSQSSSSSNLHSPNHLSPNNIHQIYQFNNLNNLNNSNNNSPNNYQQHSLHSPHNNHSNNLQQQQHSLHSPHSSSSNQLHSPHNTSHNINHSNNSHNNSLLSSPHNNSSSQNLINHANNFHSFQSPQPPPSLASISNFSSLNNTPHINSNNNINSNNKSKIPFIDIEEEEDETPTPSILIKPPKFDDDDEDEEKRPSIVNYLKNRIKRNDLSEILPFIDRLNLSYLKYKEIPNDISLFSGLIELNLSHNFLKNFNGMLIAESCPNLINLDLSFNRINNINMVIDLCNLKKLITLNISNNPIRFIDNRIAILQKLLHFKPIQMMDKEKLKDLELSKIRNAKRKPSVKFNHFNEAIAKQKDSNNNNNLLSPKSPKTPRSPKSGKLILNLETPKTPLISITNDNSNNSNSNNNNNNNNTNDQQQQQSDSNSNNNNNTNNSNNNNNNSNNSNNNSNTTGESKFMLHTESSIKKDASLFKSNPIYESQLTLNKVKKAKLLITSLRRWNQKRENSNIQELIQTPKSKIKQTVNSHIPIDMSPFIQSMNQHINVKSLQSVTTTIQLQDNSKSKVIDVKKFRGDDSPFPSLQVLNGFPISAEEYLISLNEEIYDTCSKSNNLNDLEKKNQKTLILKDNAKKIKRKIEFDSTVDFTNRKFSLNATKDLLKRRYLQQKNEKNENTTTNINSLTYDEFVKHTWVAEDDEFVDEEEEIHLEEKKSNNNNTSINNTNNNTNNNENNSNNSNNTNNGNTTANNGNNVNGQNNLVKKNSLRVHVTFSDVIKNEFYENRKVTDDILNTKRKSIIDFRPFKEQLLDLTPDQIEMKFKRIELKENSSKFRDQIEHKIDDREIFITKLKQEYEENLQKNPKKSTNLVNDDITNYLHKKDDQRKFIPKKVELISQSNTKLNVPYLDKFSLGSKYLEELGMIHDHFNEKSRIDNNNLHSNGGNTTNGNGTNGGSVAGGGNGGGNEDSKKEFEELKALKMTRKKYSLEGKKCLIDGKEFVFSNLFV